MLAHAPTGWLHPVPRSPSRPPRLRLSLSPGIHPSPLCANYTCANQPTSSEARPLALSVERVEPLLSSALGSWVEHGPLTVSAASLALLNYAEALTNFLPPMLYNPFARPTGKGTSARVDWLPFHAIPPPRRSGCPEWLIERITAVAPHPGVI